MAGIFNQSPETLFRQGCNLLKIDSSTLSPSRRNLWTDSITDAQSAFLALKGQGNIITHIREVAAPRNLVRSQNGNSIALLNAHSSLSVLLGLTLGVLDNTTFGFLGFYDQPQHRKHQ